MDVLVLAGKKGKKQFFEQLCFVWEHYLVVVQDFQRTIILDILIILHDYIGTVNFRYSEKFSTVFKNHAVNLTNV